MLYAIDCESERIQGLGDKIRSRHHVPRLACVSYAFETGPGKLVCDVTAVDTEEKNEALRAMLGAWLQGGATLVFHNAAFDIGVLAQHFQLEQEFRHALRERRILDTRILYALRRPDGKHSRTLQAAAEFVLGVTIEKGAVRTSFVPGEPLTAEQAHYAREDARVTYDLAKALLAVPYGGLSPRPPAVEQFKIHAQEVPRAAGKDPDSLFSAAAGWLAFNIEPVGLGVCGEQLGLLLGEYSRISDDLTKELRKHGLSELVRTPKAVPYRIEWRGEKLGRSWVADPLNNRMIRQWKGECQAVEATSKIPQAKLRETFAASAEELGLRAGKPGEVPLEGYYPVSQSGQLSLDYKFWRAYKDDLPEALQTYLKLAKAQKLVSTYFEPLRTCGATRVHPNIGVAFAETGRWTTWRPNLANQPKSIRKMYIPTAGHLFCTADYKSLELYTVCEAMDRLGLGGGPLRRVLDMGGDVHRNTAALLFGKTAAEVADAERQAAKVANFSLLGGLGPRKFWRQALQAGLDWTLDHAAEVRDRWFAAMTDCADYLRLFRVDPWDACPSGVLRASWLDFNGIPRDPWPSRWDLQRQLNDGAVYEVRLPSGRVVPNRRFAQAANLSFQAIGAEVISEAFNLCCEAGLRVCMCVHDSITVEAPKAEAKKAAETLARAMQEAQQMVCSCGVEIPLPEVEIGERWS